jgi:phosphoribosylaminoimidazole-succinocarboxamide synthase
MTTENKSKFLSAAEAQDIVEKKLGQGPDILDLERIKTIFPALKDCEIYEGKVSTCIFGGNLVTLQGVPLRIMIRTPRISTKDKVQGEVPFKGQVLALNHNFMRELVAGVLPHAQFSEPSLARNSIVTIVPNLHPIKVEFVMRAYNAYTNTDTSLYQHHKAGSRNFCGHALPEKLIPNGKLPFLIDTPTTKESKDRSVAPEELHTTGICTPETYALMKKMGFTAFQKVSDFLARKQIILADTKIEFGINAAGKVVAMDELFTMDSSRFWPMKNWEKSVGKEEAVLSWSKEFARGMLSGDNGYTPEQSKKIAVRYILGIQELTGEPFVPNMTPLQKEVESTIKHLLMYYRIL